MGRIPFEATFVGAYQFLFRRILSVIGTVWLPLLVACALSAGLIYLAVPPGWWHGGFPVFSEKNPDPAALLAFMQPILMIEFPVIVILMVFGAMIMVGLVQLALGQKKYCFIYFSLGGDMWRLLGAWILSYLVMILIMILMLVGGIVISSLARPYVHGGGEFLGVIAVVGCICFLIYAMVRLTFFLPAVVVAEHHIGLERSWELGRGNFWRIVLLILAIFIPVVLVASTLQQVVMSSMLASLMGAVHGQTAPDFTTVWHAFAPVLPWYGAILLLQQIALYGLTAGAVAKAYLAVTGNEVQS